MAHARETGKYPTKNSPSIERVRPNQVETLETFKNAKHTQTEWLTKKNPVRQQTDPPASRFRGKDV